MTKWRTFLTMTLSSLSGNSESQSWDVRMVIEAPVQCRAAASEIHPQIPGHLTFYSGWYDDRKPGDANTGSQHVKSVKHWLEPHMVCINHIWSIFPGWQPPTASLICQDGYHEMMNSPPLHKHTITASVKLPRYFQDNENVTFYVHIM